MCLQAVHGLRRVCRSASLARMRGRTQRSVRSNIPWVHLCRYRDSSGKMVVCGGIKLKESQAYPRAFGEAMAALYQANKHNVLVNAKADQNRASWLRQRAGDEVLPSCSVLVQTASLSMWLRVVACYRRLVNRHEALKRYESVCVCACACVCVCVCLNTRARSTHAPENGEAPTSSEVADSLLRSLRDTWADAELGQVLCHVMKSL